jgi:hypothetical protein
MSTRGAWKLMGGCSWGDERQQSVWRDADAPERNVEPCDGEPHEEHRCGEYGYETGHMSRETH